MRGQGADQLGIIAGLLLDLADRAPFDALVELDPTPGKRPERVHAVAPAVEPAAKDLVSRVDDGRAAGKANAIFGEVHDLPLPAPGPGVRLSAPPPDPLGWSGDHHLQQARR